MTFTQVTGALLKKFCKIHPKYIHILPLNKPQALQYKSDPLAETSSIIQVTAFEANHCQGSIMLLFESNSFGTILYTGSFRWYEGIANPFREKTIDLVYFDNTYSQKSTSFVTRSECKDEAVKLVQSRLSEGKCVYFIQDNVFGLEDILHFVAQKLGFEIVVSQNKMEALECMGLEQYFTTDRTDKRVFLYTKNKMNYKQCVTEILRTRTIANTAFIKISGLRRGHNTAFFDYIYFAEHSSAFEIEQFFSELRYRSATPIVVKAKSDSPKKQRVKKTKKQKEDSLKIKIRKVEGDYFNVIRDIPPPPSYYITDPIDNDMLQSPYSDVSSSSRFGMYFLDDTTTDESSQRTSPKPYIEPPVEISSELPSFDLPIIPYVNESSRDMSSSPIYNSASSTFQKADDCKVRTNDSNIDNNEININLSEDYFDILSTPVSIDMKENCESLENLTDSDDDATTIHVSESEVEEEADTCCIAGNLRGLYVINQIFNETLLQLRESHSTCVKKYLAPPKNAEEDDLVLTRLELILPKVRDDKSSLKIWDHGSRNGDQRTPSIIRYDLDYTPGFRVDDRIKDIERFNDYSSEEATKNLVIDSMNLTNSYPLSEKSTEDLFSIVRKINSTNDFVPKNRPILQLARKPLPANFFEYISRQVSPNTPLYSSYMPFCSTPKRPKSSSRRSKQKGSPTEMPATMTSLELTPPSTPQPPQGNSCTTRYLHHHNKENDSPYGRIIGKHNIRSLPKFKKRSGEDTTFTSHISL